MRPPTNRQLHALAMLASGLTTHEIRSGLGVESLYTVICHIRALVAKGLVYEAKPKGRSRRYQPTAEGLRVLGLRTCPKCFGLGWAR